MLKKPTSGKDPAKGKTPKNYPDATKTVLFGKIRLILISSRTQVSRTVNTTLVVANWLIGYTLVTHKQAGKARAGYGKELLRGLSQKLQEEFGSGYSVDDLELFRRFYLEYSDLISDAPLRISQLADKLPEISDATNRIHEFETTNAPKRRATGDNCLKPSPGRLNPDLSWSHYRALLKVRGGQMQMYVNYYDRKIRGADDNPKLGIPSPERGSAHE